MKQITHKQQEYIEEYEKYKHVVIAPGFFFLKNTSIRYEVLSSDDLGEIVSIKTIKTGNVFTKTLHWCRKNLVKE